ncbi:hypothetical protein [Leucobacter tardus]|uniref:Uncharacterized protein n=1 Tax=Leucobacter tardus TaxID=501483 RepID=A0A939QML8_9MICO|nr:hypothetical protein [Leucobacter tardus]MBO2990696.1 hypothetical protein [Leucobacter tardus]
MAEQPARIIATADRMLALDLSYMPAAYDSQFIIGWMRAAYDQSRVIASLAAQGLGHAAAPNRRAFVEIAFRLLWLRTLDVEARGPVLETFVAREKNLTTGFFDTLKEMGFDHDIDLSAMENVVAEMMADKELKQQVKAVTDAAKAAPITLGLYTAWREETQYTHATGHLAVAYAPKTEADRVGRDEPPVQHGDLNTHHMITLLVGTLTAELLKDAGLPQKAVEPILFTAWDAV